MKDFQIHDPEEVGSEFSILGMLETRAKTRAVIHEVADHIEPGMRENEAVHLTKGVLADAGMARTWHPVVVRFGANTAKTLAVQPASDVALGENDIFFIDIGPRFGPWEGDAGETFVVGDHAEHVRCARDVKALFHEIRALWISEGFTGADLYRHAREAASNAGWLLDLDVAGHRISDYPHTAIHAGTLAQFDRRPAAMRWVAECHIRDPEGRFGAFFEDLLLPDEYYA
ncbi:Xaa-Pro aminopeptidase [Paraburkholderia piptadeniae]|uniref:Xaa-Pro aminopeptidase n=1 Tax=Paraburkholderia piptadeniae TaxID=1701573 RepID=A0A1N7RYP6_9BURK|nr:M24 family metallopeptidase [Paraburkholderia piptadeniae]SIT40184.1 Xaa-Pro aminopeptidase [Paraburkholderia piptadeniae]